jgi:hypothetical protein
VTYPKPENKELYVHLDSVGEVIAVRTLKLQDEQGTPSEVSVLIGKPQKTPGFDEYYCPYQVKGAGPEKIRYACGVDAVQALLLTLWGLGVELEVLNSELGGRLSWECDEKGGFGFPDMTWSSRGNIGGTPQA